MGSRVGARLYSLDLYKLCKERFCTGLRKVWIIRKNIHVLLLPGKHNPHFRMPLFISDFLIHLDK